MAVDTNPLLAGVSEAQPQKYSNCHLKDKCFLSHGFDKKDNTRKKLLIALILCFTFMVLEVIGGYIAHSVAIMADAAHMLSDVASFAVSVFAAWVVTKKSSASYSFGYHRVEILGALISVLTIWSVTGALLYEATMRIINPQPVNGKIMFIIACAGIVFNIIIGLVLGEAGHAHHGHSHGPDHGHSHGPEHIHAAGEDHVHEHEHKHDHAEGKCKGHKHDEEHDHKDDHEHEHKHDHAEGKCKGHKHDEEHNHEHNHDHEHEHKHDHAEGKCKGHGKSGSSKASEAAEQQIEVKISIGNDHDHDHHSDDSSDDGDHTHDHDNLNMRGAVMHVIGDLLQSIGVAIAGGLIWMHEGDSRWVIADPICTFVFAVLVMYTTVSILRDVMQTLMEGAPSHFRIGEISEGISKVPGVIDVHDLHVWNLSMGVPVLTAHLHVQKTRDNADVLKSVESFVKKLGIKHSTIQVCNPSSGGSQGLVLDEGWR